MEAQMVHLNYNSLCVMSIRTTGPNPTRHDIVRFAATIVDNNLKISKNYPPLLLDMKPRRPENLNGKRDLSGPRLQTVTKKTLMELSTSGLDPYLAADRLEEWFRLQKLPGQKRLVPLVYNWANMLPFMIDWLGFEHCNQFFANQVRDLLVLAVAANDKAYMKSRPFPYPKPIFSILARNTGVHRYSKDPAGDCVTIVSIFRRMLLKEPLVVGGQF